MAYREIISDELRFNIFKRDNFTCQYCGRKAPDVVLELDHIRPVSKGGDKRESNLITSCFECNRGKKDSLVPEMEDKDAQDDFEENYKKYKSRYGYYTNYIAKVIRNETGIRPMKLYIDKFVKRSFKTDDDFCEFKKEFYDMENALLMIKRCEKLGTSYKADRISYTKERIETIKKFKCNEEIYEKYRKLEWKIHKTARDMGNGSDSFKNKVTTNTALYFFSKKLETMENIEEEIENFSEAIEEYVDFCMELLKETGKEYFYAVAFASIDDFFKDGYIDTHRVSDYITIKPFGAIWNASREGIEI